MGSTAERVKTTAIVIAYLASFMVVAIPVGMAPTDSTPDHTPAQDHRESNVEFDYGLYNSTSAPPADRAVVSGTPQVDTSTHFHITNITGPNIKFAALFAPSVNKPIKGSIHFNNNLTYTRTGEEDGGTLEADFPKVTFNETGTWTIIYNKTNPSTFFDKQLFNVSGVKDIEVSVTPEQFAFPGDKVKRITVEAVWASNGTPVENAEVEITAQHGSNPQIVPGTENETDSDGVVEYSHNFWQKGGADTYDVTVCWPKQQPQNCLHTNTESVEMQVDPAELTAEDIDGTPVTEGFTGQVDWDLRYPTNDPRHPIAPLSQWEGDNSSLSWNSTLLESGKNICKNWHGLGGGDIYDKTYNNATPGMSTTDPSNNTAVDLEVLNVGSPSWITIFNPSGTEHVSTNGTGELGGTSAWFNNTPFMPADTSGAWNMRIKHQGMDRTDRVFNVSDPCSAEGTGEIESLWHLQNGNVSAVKQWNSTEYALGVEIQRIGSLLHPEYVFNSTFETEPPEPPVLSIGEDEGDVPDGCLNMHISCSADGLGDTLAPGTGNGWARPNGSEVHQDGDALINSATPDGNGQYTLTIQGTTADDFPDEANLSIEVSGHYLGEPTFWADNGTQLFDGTGGTHWTIPSGLVHVRDITPMRGRSDLNFEVTWDHPTEGTVSDTIKHRVRDGVRVSTSPDEVTVGEDTTVTVHVEGGGGTPIPDAQVSLFWTRNGTNVPLLNVTEGNDTAGFGQDGDYTFEVDIDQAVGEVTAHADDQFDKDGFATLEVVPAHDLDTDVSPDGDLAGRDTTYTLNVTRDGDAFDDQGDDLDIYVLNEEQWDDFQDNGSSALPSPLAATEYSRDSEGNFTFDWRAESGTYHVYVKTAPKHLHDNLGQVPTIEVEPAEVSWDPETLVSKVDKDVTVDVHLHDPTADSHDASEVNGTLVLLTGGVNTPGNGDGLPNATFGNNSAGTVTAATDTGGTRSVAVNATGIDITNGDGHIDNVSAKRPGPVKAFFVDASSGARYALTDTPLQIVAPDVAVTPDLVCVGVTTQVTATVTHPVTGDPISGATVNLTQSGVRIANETTDSQGVAQMTVFLTNSSLVRITVNGDRAATFAPKQCMSISFDKQTYTEGDTVMVTVSQRGNPDVQIQGATILLDGSSVGTTGSDGSITFQAPSAGTHLVRAQKTGFADATAEFETEPATQPSQFDVSGVSAEDADKYLVDNTYTVTGTVSNTGGEAGTANVQFVIDGAVSDSTSLTLNPGASQEVAFQWTPSSTGDVNLAISADGAQDSTTITVEEEEPTVPGFEVVAVLAALGAAAVVLRRD